MIMMNSVSLVLFVTVVFCSLSLSEGVEMKKVDVGEYESMVTTPGMTVSLFYEEDGSYAEEVEDFFLEAGKRINQNQFPNLRVAAIDVRKHRLLAQRSAISTFPTIVVYLTTFEFDGQAITILVRPHPYTGDLSLPLLSLQVSNNDQQSSGQEEPKVHFDESKLESLIRFIIGLYPPGGIFDLVQEQKQRKSLELQKLSYFPQRHLHKIESLSANDFIDLVNLENDPATSSQLSLIEFHFGKDYDAELAWFARSHSDWKVFRVQCFFDRQLCDRFGFHFDPSKLPSSQPPHFVIVKGNVYTERAKDSEQSVTDWCGSISQDDEWKPVPVVVPEEREAPHVVDLSDEPAFYSALHNHIHEYKGREKFVFLYYSEEEARREFSKTQAILGTFKQLPNLLPYIRFFQINVDALSKSKTLLVDFHVESVPAIQLALHGRIYQFEGGLSVGEESSLVEKLITFIDTAFQQSSNFDVREERIQTTTTTTITTTTNEDGSTLSPSSRDEL